MGLWATICSLEEAAKCADKTIQYAIRVNGREYDEPLNNLAEWLGNRITIDISNESVPPPIARNHAAAYLDAEWLCFVDDHVLLEPEWFRKMFGEGIRFSSYKANQYRYYHFIPDKDLPTKGDYSREPVSKWLPYPCLSAPNGGFLMRKEVWDAIGGYEPWYETFGGEETDLAFKAHLKGIPVNLVPQAYYYHYSVRSEVRGHDKTIDQANYRRLWEALGKPQAVVDKFLAIHS